jgi:hypothetical protein
MLEVYLLKDGLNIAITQYVCLYVSGKVFYIRSGESQNFNDHDQRNLTSHSQVVPEAPPASKTAPSQFFANYKLYYIFS